MSPLSPFLKTALTAILLLGGPAAYDTIARAAQPSSLPAVLQRVYSAQDAAAERKDVAAMFAQCAPRFTDYDTKGHASSLATDMDGFSRMSKDAQSIKSRTQVLSASVTGNTATASIKQHVELTITNPQSGQPVVMAIDATSRDTWVKTAAGWRETASHTLTETSTVNGVPFDPTKPGPAPTNGA